MRLLYLCLAHCLLPIAFLRELWRAFRHPEYRAGLTARLGCGARLAPGLKGSLPLDRWLAPFCVGVTGLFVAWLAVDNFRRKHPTESKEDQA